MDGVYLVDGLVFLDFGIGIVADEYFPERGGGQSSCSDARDRETFTLECCSSIEAD